MAEQKTYRHRVTGNVGTYPTPVARAMGDVLEEVKEGSKPKRSLGKTVAAAKSASAKSKGTQNGR